MATSDKSSFRSRRLPPALLAITVLMSLACPASPAGAAGPTFALKPASTAKLGYFVLPATPGSTVHGKVEVINVGTKAGRTSLYSVDATTGQTSGAVYRSRGEPRRDIGGWIRLAQSTIELGPGRSQVVPFSVHVPSGAAAGQHLGGIVAQRSTQAASGKAVPGGKKKNGFQVRIQALSVLAVQVDVPGPKRARMTLTGIKPGDQPGHQSLLLGIGNAGNILLKGTGSLKVVNHSGRQVQRQSFNLDTFVPGTHIDFPVYIQGKALPPGRYRGTVSIAYQGQELTRTFPFTISAGQVAQVFGTQASHAPTVASSSRDKALLYALAAVALSSLGAAFYFWRSRRPV